MRKINSKVIILFVGVLFLSEGFATPDATTAEQNIEYQKEADKYKKLYEKYQKLADKADEEEVIEKSADKDKKEDDEKKE